MRFEPLERLPRIAIDHIAHNPVLVFDPDITCTGQEPHLYLKPRGDGAFILRGSLLDSFQDLVEAPSLQDRLRAYPGNCISCTAHAAVGKENRISCGNSEHDGRHKRRRHNQPKTLQGATPHAITPALYVSTTYAVVWESAGMATPNTSERNPSPNSVGWNSSVAVYRS